MLGDHPYATMQRANLTDAVYETFSASAKEQSNMAEGRFWEQGLFALMPHIASFVASPQRLQAGLELTRDYMQGKGITIGNEPGGILAKPMQDAVNASGRVAGAEQRVAAEQALRGITIEAAHSLKLGDEIGTITPGKRANFTVLADNPLSVDPLKIKNVAVWGTVMEGRVPPAVGVQKKADAQPVAPRADATAFSEAALHHALKVAHAFN